MKPKERVRLGEVPFTAIDNWLFWQPGLSETGLETESRGSPLRCGANANNDAGLS